MEQQTEQQTFIMSKPDGVGEIISTFEKKGFQLKGLKLIIVDRCFAERHYADLSANPSFSGLVDYIISGLVVAMVWEGENVVTSGRKIIGATNTLDAAPGTIGGDFAVEIGRNVIHGSDSVESAMKEIALWFPEAPVSWESSLHPWIYENVIHASESVETASDSVETASEEIAPWFPFNWESSVDTWIYKIKRD